MLRFFNYLLREPRVPLGLLEKYVLPPFDDAFLANIGFWVGALPAEPWFLGFFPPAMDFFMCHLLMQLVVVLRGKPED